MSSGIVFVTVGSTRFDTLIKSVDSPEVADALIAKGFRKLVMQIGNAQYAPCQLFPQGTKTGIYKGVLATEYFDYAPSLAAYMQKADLIISHAGSGSIFESLRLGKPLIAVPNPILMANHQAELASELSEQGYLFYSTAEGLSRTIVRMDTARLVKYAPGNPEDIAKHIDALMGLE